MKNLFVLLMVLTLTVAILAFSSMGAYAKYGEDSAPVENQNNNNTRAGTPVEGEEWFGITLVDGIPQIANAINYSEMPELLTYLKPGDIIYERVLSNDFLSTFGHIAMVVDIIHDDATGRDFVLLIESMPSYGVSYGLLTPERFEGREIIITRITNATDIQKQGAIEWAKGRLGKNWMVNTDKSYDPDKDSWYCSELIWAAFYSQGIYLDPNDGSIVFPSEVSEYVNSAVILDQRNETTVTSNNDMYHTFYCNGSTYTEEHNYEYYDYFSEKCSVCNHLKVHDYDMYDTNYEKCNSCGHFRGHNFTYTPQLGRQHIKSCACGYSAFESCIGSASIGGTSYCMNCRQELSFIFKPLFTDEEEYLPNDKENDEE